MSDADIFFGATSLMNESLKDRLNKIMDRIQSPALLSNFGLGNEIGFYIFDYPPEDELVI